MIVNKDNIKNLYFVGRNYLEHTKELNNEKPDQVLLFTKSLSSLSVDGKLQIPPHSSDIHFEGEMVFFISDKLLKINDETEIIAGCGLDFTARDVQSKAKSKGWPWFEAKCFKGSAVISDNFAVIKGKDLNGLQVKTEINAVQKQLGSYTEKMFKLQEIVKHMNRFLDFSENDIVFTGTPSGVGVVKKGDKIKVSLLLNNKEIAFSECEVI